MKKLELLTAGLLCAGLISHIAVGQVAKKARTHESHYLQYEGVLTDASGVKKTGEHIMTFMIFDSPDAKMPQWVEIHNVLFTEGDFNVTLGKKTPLPSLLGESSCIGISINGEELTPRQAVNTSDAVASHPVVTEKTRTADVSRSREPFLFQDDDWNYWTSAPDMYSIPAGNVGIGTMSPSSKLHVEGSDTVEALVLVKNLEGGFGLRAESIGSPSSTASHFGLFGGAEGPGPASVGSMGAAVNSDSGMAYGHYGIASNTGTGFAYGSYGVASNPGSNWAYGVHGLGENTGDGLAFGGLFSTADSGTGAHYGVQALSYGTSSSPMVGVHGFGQNNAGGEAYGAFFEAPNFGTGVHYGVWSDSYGTSGLPMYGIYSNTGNFGFGTAYAGYYLTGAIDDDSGDNYGVFANVTSGGSNQSIGVYGYGINHGGGPAYGGYFGGSSYGTGVHYGVYGSEEAGGSGAAVYASGDQIASGTKSAVVKTASSGHRLMYTVESSEVWFEDVGEGQLAGGRTRIELDPLFLETVTIDDTNPMQVFVQLTSGEPMPTVVEKGIAGFEVRVSNKESDASFSYRVMAKRKGYEDERIRETDVGYEDPTLYPELSAEIERKLEERRQREELESRRMEELNQQIQVQERQMKNARLGEVVR